MAAGCYGGATDLSEVVAIGSADASDKAEMAHACDVSGQGGGGKFGEPRLEVGAAYAGDVECWTLQGAEQVLLDGAEEIDWLDGFAVDGARASDPVERSDTGGEIVEGGQIVEIAPIAAEQDVLQVHEAVDGLLARGELPCGWTVPMFHLSVVLERGDVVGGGFQTQDESELIVHLYGGFAEVMLDAGAFDAG